MQACNEMKPEKITKNINVCHVIVVFQCDQLMKRSFSQICNATTPSRLQPLQDAEYITEDLSIRFTAIL